MDDALLEFVQRLSYNSFAIGNDIHEKMIMDWNFITN